MNSFTCSETRQSLGAYLDAELEERDCEEIESHFLECAECREHLDFERSVRGQLREDLDRAGAPERLRAQILDGIDLLEDEDEAQPWRRWGGWKIVSLSSAAALMIGLVLFTFVNTQRTSEGATGLLTGDVAAALQVASRSLQVNPDNELITQSLDWHQQRLPLEVTGPRPEDVREWFQGKVEFTVHLPRFNRPDVALLGGRLAYVRDRKAALLTMLVKQRRLSVMVFRSGSTPTTTRRVRPRVVIHRISGYNIALVRSGDLTYSVISDLPRRDFDRLVNANFLRGLR